VAVKPPFWIEWDYEMTHHVRHRMVARGFNETDLRTMLASASFVGPDHEPGCFRLQSVHNRRHWEIIVRPDQSLRLIFVVTAYSIS
jgi:hypothetical protein